MGLKETGWNPTGFESSEGLQVGSPPHTVYKRACCATPPRIQRGRKCECVWVGDGVENKWIIQLNQPWNLACGQCSLKQRDQVSSGFGNFCAHAHKFVVCVSVCGVCVCVLWKPPCRHPLYFMRKEVTELLRQWNISIFFPHQSVQLNYFLKIQVLIFFKELNRKNNPSLLTQLTPNIILEFTLYLNRLHVRSKWSHRKGKKAKTTTHSPHGLHLHCVHLQPHKKKSIFWIPRVICWQLERWLKFMFYKNFVLIIFII